jgi:hypothetical protein
MNSDPVDEYVEAELQRLLTEHRDIAEQGITVRRREQVLVLSGEVASAQRRDDIMRLVHERFPEARLQVDIGLTRTLAPREAEELP